MTASTWREVPASAVKEGQRVRLHLPDDRRRSDTVVTATATQSSNSVWVGDYRTDIHVDGRRYEVEVPSLPTEPGTVIDGTVRGETGHRAVLTSDDHGSNVQWLTVNAASGCTWHDPCNITDWTLVAPAPGGEA